MRLTLVLLLLVSLELGVVTPIQHTTSEKKWAILLKTIGAKNIEVISVTDDKVIIKTNKENLKPLRKLLESEDELQKNTLHALFCNNRLGTGNYNTKSFNIKDNEWFRKVVSDEFIKENDLVEVFDAMKANVHFDEKLLIIELQFTLSNLLDFLTFRLNLVKLQSAITDEKTLVKLLTGEEPLVVDHDHAAPSQFAKVISQIVSNEDNFTVNFIINNGAFAQTYQSHIDDGKPPIIASDLNGLFIIDKEYILKFLSPMFNGLVWSEEDKIPIVFHSKRPDEEVEISAYDFNILIDTSSSMKSSFSTYIKNIKVILDKLGNIPNWQIQIVRFGTVSVRKTFSLKSGHTINDVKRFVDRFDASGTTRLYCTVEEALIDIRKKLTDKPDLYSTLMVFTDGDNTEGCTENDVLNAASYLNVIPQFNLYAIGFDMTESGFQSFFKKLTEAGGFIHVRLDHPTGMTQLLQYINTLTQKINLWEILQGELHLSISRVPEGDVYILDSEKQADVNGITVVKNNNEKFKIGKGDLNCTRAASPTYKVIY